MKKADLKPTVRDLAGGKKEYLYSDNKILAIVRQLPVDRKVRVLTKALNILDDKSCSKAYALAQALGCRLDNLQYIEYVRSTPIKF